MQQLYEYFTYFHFLYSFFSYQQVESLKFIALKNIKALVRKSATSKFGITVARDVVYYLFNVEMYLSIK